MKSLFEMPTDLSGKRVLVRVDFNVPLVDVVVMDSDAGRIRVSFETIDYLETLHARIILISHFGRTGETLKPVADYLNSQRACTFVPAVIGEQVTEEISLMEDGDIILLENIRTHAGEESNEEEFVKQLAGLADYYVNDAFSASHRAHASIVGIPAVVDSYMGRQFEREYDALSRVLNPEHPFILIVGGSKFETKLPVLSKFLVSAERVFVGGALVNTLLAKRGFQIGKSLTDPTVDVTPFVTAPNLVLPDRVIVDRDGLKLDVPVTEVLPQDTIFDISPTSMDRLAPIFERAKTVLWNGPLGMYEKGYVEGTLRMIELMKSSSAFRVVGGGDTLSLIESRGLHDSFSFVSTAGGAMLDYLATGTLPGIEALDKGVVVGE